MSSIKIEEVETTDTVELIVHHNNPLKYTRVKKDEYRWVLARARGSTSQEEITHLSGKVVSNNVKNRVISIYGGPYSAKGLSSQFCSRGIDKDATAEIPWQYIGQLWVLRRKEIDSISKKHQRLTTERIKVLV